MMVSDFVCVLIAIILRNKVIAICKSLLMTVSTFITRSSILIAGK